MYLWWQHLAKTIQKQQINSGMLNAVIAIGKGPVCIAQKVREVSLFIQKHGWSRHNATLVTLNSVVLCITRSAVAQHYVNGDTSSQWEESNSDPPPCRIETLKSSVKKLAKLIMSAGGFHMPNLVTIHTRGTSGQMVEVWLVTFSFFDSFFSDTLRD